jgi:uncharacterized protein YciI
MRLHAQIPLVLALVLAGCSSTPHTQEPVAERYTLVYLKTGPRKDLTPEEGRDVFAGHFANMTRLAEERELLVAGPYGQPKHDPALRGLFILDEPTVEGAEALASTDPGVIAGVFRLELHELRTDAPLRPYLERELAIEAAAKAEGRQRAPGEGGRTYVLLTAVDGAAAQAALAPLADDGRLLMQAWLDGTQLLALLDAVDVPAAEALLAPHREAIGPHVLDQWFASGELARLASFGG